MIHPWTTRRKAAGITQLEMADLLGVSRHMVIRLEQSLYHEPSAMILGNLETVLNENGQILRREYLEYVQDMRTLFKVDHLNFKDFFRNGYSGTTHPLVYYRLSYDLSRMGFCKGLCLDYGPITDYEHNKQRGLPLELKLASESIGWEYVDLEEAVTIWRADGRADRLAG